MKRTLPVVALVLAGAVALILGISEQAAKGPKAAPSVASATER
jgi:hypothetical protein